MSQLSNTKLSDKIDNELLNLALKKHDESTRILYFGMVIKNTDSLNCKRIQIRIPYLDDIYYLDGNVTNGNNNLPWCIPMNSRFIDVPEEGTIVSIIISDPRTPYYGRVYLDSFTGISAIELFSNLSPQEQITSNWLNVSNELLINIPVPSTPNNFQAGNNIDYKVGIRGKGNNGLIFDEASTKLTQNDSLPNETSIEMTNDLDMQADNLINLISTSGYNQHYHPIFDTTLYSYLDSIQSFHQKLMLMLATNPATAPNGPCTPSPKISSLINEFVNLKTSLVKLKQIGNSKKLTIN